MDDVLHDGTGLPPAKADPAGDTPQTPGPTLDVPDGSLDDLLGWVGAGEPGDERRARADAVYAREVQAGNTDLDQLGRLLTYHVYREQNQAAVVPPEQVPGEVVQSETAGTGEAVNAATGEVTAPGEPLPPVEGDGTPPAEAPTEAPAAPTEPPTPAPAPEAQPTPDTAPQGDPGQPEQPAP